MKAILVRETGGPEVLRLEDVPDPTPAANQVLIRVEAAGVNPVETYKRSGKYARSPALPWIPGSDAAGVVERVGSGVKGFQEGDRVYTDHRAEGAYAELMLCDAGQVYPLPDATSFVQGAALGVPYATAYRAVFQRGRGRPGETVLVHGATGGVGLAAVQLASAAGLRVIGTGGTQPGRDEVLRQGASDVFDHHEAGYLERVVEATGGDGPDLIVEMLANVNLGRDLEILAKWGRVVVVGSRGTVEIDARNTMAKDADIRGFTMFNTPPEELRQIHDALHAGLEGGTIAPVVDEEIPLAEAPRAHERVMADGHQGKIVLIP